MPSPKKNFSKRTNGNFAEKAMGLQGKATAQALDFFSNAAARTGWGTPNLAESTSYPLVRMTLDYWQMIALFEGSWIARRIVELPCQAMVKAWPTITGDIDPKDLTKMDRALRRTNSKAKILTALTWAKLFGGAGCLIAVEGQEDELDQPLDLDSVPLGGFQGLIPFDRWCGITPSSDVCTDITRPLDFGLPESYTVRAVGGDSFEVHSSRILRFMGPAVPTPEKEAYSSWGISVIEPVFQDLQKYDNISFNILALNFRANILGMKFPELAQLLSGVGMPGRAAEQFERRMSAVNQLISNQSLVPLPTDGSIESTSYSFAGLSEVFQQFQLAISGAAQIPVTRFWGKTITGLGNGANEGDETVFCERIATDQETDMRPQLDKLYPVISMSELGHVDDDLDLSFPSLKILTEQEKADLAKTTVDSVTVCINSGVFSPRTAGKEIKQASAKTGFGTNLTDKAIDKLSDDVQSEGELGQGLFGEEGAKTLDPAGSPEAALKETDKLSGKGDEDDGGGEKKPEPAKEGVKKPEPEEKAQAKDAALRPDGTKCNMCGERVMAGRCAGCGDNINTHCDAANSAIQCQDCGKWLGNCCCFNQDPRGTRCNKCYKKWPGSKLDRKYATDSDDPGQPVTVHGIECVIETPKGGIRSGPGWKTVMPAHYGYIKGVRGADGDSLDCYVGPESNGWAYVIDQATLDGLRYDEAKVLLNFSSAQRALNTYRAGHHKADDIMLDWTPMPIDELKQWMRSGDLTKPCSPEAMTKLRNRAATRQA
jgi:phage-related protein (TIGR01555 family)